MNFEDSLYEFKIGTAHAVNVCYINHPHSFYVRAANVEDNFLQTLEEPGRTLTEEEIYIGKAVVYQSNTLRKYVRGQVRFISTDESAPVYDIFAKDYGCIDTSVSSENIHGIGNKAELENQCPPLAVHCQLDLCEARGDGFAPDVADSMKYFVGDHEAEIIIRSKINDKLKVVLKTPDCPCDVSTMLALLNVTAMTKCDSKVNKLGQASGLTKKKKYKMYLPGFKEMLHVRVLGGESLSSFHVAKVGDYKDFTKEQNRFTFSCKNSPQLTDVTVGTSCGVNVSSFVKYERAIILKITVPDEEALVLLIDSGKEAEVPFSKMKSVEAEHYFVKPALSILCAAEANQAWVTTLPKFLYPGYEFIIRITEVGDGINVPHKVDLIKM